jgi:hypothetical protein
VIFTSMSSERNRFYPSPNNSLEHTHRAYINTQQLADFLGAHESLNIKLGDIFVVVHSRVLLPCYSMISAVVSPSCCTVLLSSPDSSSRSCTPKGWQMKKKTCKFLHISILICILITIKISLVKLSIILWTNLSV